MSVLLRHHRSETADRLAEILRDLQAQPEIEQVHLATDDGIPIEFAAYQDGKAGVVAGFILAAARQGFGMLALEPVSEITIREEFGRLFVSNAFSVGESWLVLTLVFHKDMPYKRLVNQTIADIVSTVEK